MLRLLSNFTILPEIGNRKLGDIQIRCERIKMVLVYMCDNVMFYIANFSFE